MAADIRRESAIRRIFEIKGRPTNRPLIVHLPREAELSKWALNPCERARRLAEAFWPGPMTLLLRKRTTVSDYVTGGQPTVGLRIPAQPLLLEVLQHLGSPIAAPSANPYQALSPTTAQHVAASLGNRISTILDGGPTHFGIESTIVDLTGSKVRILRPGPIEPEAIETILGERVMVPQKHADAVPGNDKSHYQPTTPMRLVTERTLLESIDLPIKDRIGVMCRTQSFADHALALGISTADIKILPCDPAGYARLMFQTLFDLDRNRYQRLWVQLPPHHPQWRAIHDRLRKASK